MHVTIRVVTHVTCIGMVIWRFPSRFSLFRIQILCALPLWT